MPRVLNIHTHTHIHTQTEQGDIRNLLEVMDMFISLIVVMVSHPYACVQSHQSVYIKYMQSFPY